MSIKISELFDIKCGDAPSFDDYVDITDDSQPTVAYVSASTTRNGINGFVVPQQDNEVFTKNLVTVAVQGQGSVAFATVQPHQFVASKLVAVLTPKIKKFDEIGLECNPLVLSVICSLIRKQRWRFSFGRTASVYRIKMITISIDRVKEVLLKLKSAGPAGFDEVLGSLDVVAKGVENVVSPCASFRQDSKVA